MPPSRRRLYWVCGAIAALTALVNSPIAELAFDAPVGLQWSANIVTFLKANTQGLILLVGFELLMEFTGFEWSGAEERRIRDAARKLNEQLINDLPANVIVEAGLTQMYGAGAASIAKLVSPARWRLLQANIVIRVRRSPLPNTPPAPGSVPPQGGSQTPATLDLYHHIEFEWSGGDFLYAVAADAVTSDGALSGIEEVLECTMIADANLTLTQFTTKLNDHIAFLVLPHDGRPPERLTLKPVPPKVSKRLALKAGIDPGKINLFSGSGGHAGDRMRIETRQSQEKTINNVWWVADRPVEVRGLRLDVTDLVPSTSAIDLTLFMNLSNQTSGLLEPGLWQFWGANWIVKGQGVHLSWHEA